MPQAGYVYMLHGVGTNFIKIGKTTNILKRLHTLEHGVPFALQIVRVELVHDMNQVETAWKERYRIYQTRGEWFALPQELLEQWPLDGEFTLIGTPARPLARPKDYQRQPAMEWLQSLLASGRMATADILEAARVVGINEKTLRRAKAALRIAAVKDSHAWYWQLRAIPVIDEDFS